MSKITKEFLRTNNSYITRALILCLPHSESLALIFHISSLAAQEGFSEKLQQTLISSAFHSELVDQVSLYRDQQQCSRRFLISILAEEHRSEPLSKKAGSNGNL